MRKIAAIAGIVFLITINLSAVEKVDTKKLLSESLDIYNHCEKINSLRKTACKDLDKSQNDIISKLWLLEQPVFTEKMIWQHKEDIALSKKRIALNKAYLEIAKITDPNERAKLAQKYDQDIKRLTAEEEKASKPFLEKIDKLEQEVKDKQEPFEKAMQSYCLCPKADYSILGDTEISAPYLFGTLTYKWNDKENIPVAWAWISIYDKPEPKPNAKMLHNTLYVNEHWPKRIDGWAGHFRINLYLTKASLFGKDKVAKIIKDFIDLDGLSKIDPAKSDNGINALIKDNLLFTKKYRSIVLEKNDVVNPIKAEYENLEKLKERLRKRPASSERLKLDKQEIDYFTRELENFEQKLEIGTITDAKKRAEMKKKFQAEKKKLDAKIKKTEKPYYDKIAKLTKGIESKDALLNDAIKGYFLKGGNGYEVISKPTTKATFSKATIEGKWNDQKFKEICSATVQLRNLPVIPENAKMLDGLYYVSDISTNKTFIRVWAGNFDVSFKIRKKEWLKKEEIGEILKKFIDLPRLAKAF